ncbi:MIF4G-like type 3 [Trinorchestia longiramus]|nr:MIF4G-like type 3 [Trinorchestia longiramus]
MDDGSRAGRGRGRGMAPGEEHRGDLRRPLTTPQELSAALHQPSNVCSNVKVFNDNRGQPQFSNDAKSPQMMHGRTVQHQNDAQMQKELAFANKAIVSQEMANHQQLQMALQSQAANQQLSNQAHYAIQAHQQHMANQQMLNQQFANLVSYGNPQLLQQQRSHGAQSPQVVPVGIHSGNISLIQQFTPQKTHEYEELKKKEFQLEQMKMHEAQNSAQEQQRLQYQRQKLISLQMSDLELHHKLAALQVSHPEALYLQQSPQQQFIQQQHMDLQKQHHHQQIQQHFHQSQLNAMSTQAESSSRSTLSADAAVFVPRFSASNGQHLESANGVPKLGNSLLPQQSSGHVSLIQIQPELACHPVVVQVDTAVVQLSGNPSKYDSIAHQLTRLLSWEIKEENLMREVVTVIFEQGVGEANFRFTGGKLCEHLVKNVVQQYNGLSFKSILLQRCQEEFEFRHDYLAVQFYDRLIGFTFFLAEILTRLLMPSGNPIAKLKEALCKMLNLLLEVSTNESLKCVAQVLKMSGRYLQMGEIDDLENVMVKLRDIAMTPIPPNIKNLLMSVVEFRAANWGCNSDDSSDTKQNGETDDKAASTTSGPAANGGLPVLGTVFYGPDGAIQRIEEDCPEDYPSDSDDSASRQSQPKVAPQVHELDEDEGAAFEQFLMSMN